MHAKLTLIVAAVSLLAADAVAQNAGQVRIKGHVHLRDGREHEVPALVAGPLVALEVREGREVEAGTVLGRIDDKQAQANKEERSAEVEVAREQAQNDVNVRFAEASLQVAQAEYQKAIEANKKAPNSITHTELMRLALNVKKTGLQIEVAEMEMRIAKFTMGAKEARVKEIEGIIDRSEIKAPISGMVVEVSKQRGEWCEPGATVLKMVQMDLLRVEGTVNAANLNVADVSNKPVTVQVNLAGNAVEQFRGKIVHVDPRVRVGGAYTIVAEVENRKNRAQTHWLLRPGSEAEIVIDLRGGVALDNPASPMKNAATQTTRR